MLRFFQIKIVTRHCVKTVSWIQSHPISRFHHKQINPSDKDRRKYLDKNDDETRHMIKLKRKAKKWIDFGETVTGTHAIKNGTVQRFRSMCECEVCGQFVKNIQYTFHGHYFHNMMFHQIYKHCKYIEDDLALKIINEPKPQFLTDNLNMKHWSKKNCRCDLTQCSYCSLKE